MKVEHIRQAIWPFQESLDFVVRLPNGNIITEGSIALERDKGGFVLSLVPPNSGPCPFCGTAEEEHLPPLPGTAMRRCPRCCHAMHRIRSLGVNREPMYWSNEIDGWVSDPSQATLFPNRNDPTAPMLREGSEWEEAFNAPRTI